LHLLHYVHHVRRTPHSPLFPYTTLFRSNRSEAGPLGYSETSNIAPFADVSRSAAGVRSVRKVAFRSTSVPENSSSSHWGTRRSGDRKSTRLNSSHRTISYAVFCLKKKRE